ncbi:hypothetical protein VOLCADRAFT_89384 [Volvox carteri f. nagariensis]|uniref:Tafazzin family protein n=1 Tax=Volvox carteri f. nagariensis TaxID=3068 RepID=D8TRK1_VOLCA|nr:uncharacterized protein VOLCADRAFT_89384 [Volvox carteri f. nagariensis]EFJ50008.1 hypothetical protein VOLCADRAFT_89384 [Volvox carteri f. nagariensis]|eukprot:XP_002949073.1 hypothetical protein VOLCADRAFT_89384 [Volvox carteri f. nagariensis]
MCSMFDDPGVLSIIMPWSWLWMDPVQNHVRWSLCAKEVCFKNELLRSASGPSLDSNFLPSPFISEGSSFSPGKLFLWSEGKAAGVHQPVVSLASMALASGQWVHVFPEGRINYDGRLGPLRWGCGKLVCEARQLTGGRDPVVLPFYHSNMGSVLPLSGGGFSVGHKVEVRIGAVGTPHTQQGGEPLQLADLTCRCDSPSLAEQQETWRLITERVRLALLDLERQSPPNPDQSANVPAKGGPPPS